MKTNFNILDRNAKKRIIIFTIITVLISVIEIGFIWSVCNGEFFYDELIDSESPPGLLFSATAWLIGGMLSYIFYTIGGNVLIVNVEVLAYGIFYAKKIKGIEYVEDTEYILATWILNVMLIVSIVISFFVARTALIQFFFTEWPIFFMRLFGYLFYLSPLKQKSQNRQN